MPSHGAVTAVPSHGTATAVPSHKTVTAVPSHGAATALPSHGTAELSDVSVVMINASDSIHSKVPSASMHLPPKAMSSAFQVTSSQVRTSVEMGLRCTLYRGMELNGECLIKEIPELVMFHAEKSGKMRLHTACKVCREHTVAAKKKSKNGTIQ